MPTLTIPERRCAKTFPSNISYEYGAPPLAARFYFDLAGEDEIIRDDVGIEAGGPEEVASEARAAIATMKRDDELPVAAGGWHLVIRGEDDVELYRFPIG